MLIRRSQFLFQVQREFSADAEVLSHKLMLRAGYIAKVASGIYLWQPIGLLVLQKVIDIVRKEHKQNNLVEVLLPALQPAELWQKSGRWQKYGKELMRLKDRHNSDFCLGPTHEEVVVDYFNTTINSYKDLPLGLFQIQTKMRDEIRPRFGIMRSREFVMKDAYSFHLDTSCLKKFYQKMKTLYVSIFDTIGLNYAVVSADSGGIGGSTSEEFHVLAKTGEDSIVFSDQSKFKSSFGSNIELAPSYKPEKEEQKPQKLTLVETPKCISIQQVTKHLNISERSCLKSIILSDGKELLCVVLRGDDQLSLTKTANRLNVETLFIPTAAEIKQKLGTVIGFIGPKDLSIPLYVDQLALASGNYCCGANVAGKHYINFNWSRDAENYISGDFRQVKVGERFFDNSGNVEIKKGIEVGHIFMLGDKYTKAMSSKKAKDQKKGSLLQMGCYGIGISRIVAAAIEQNSTLERLVLPQSIAPFHIAIIPINFHKLEPVKEFTENVSLMLSQQYQCLLFDKNMRLGEMLKDFEFSGIPCALIIGIKNVEKSQVEIICNNEKTLVATENISSFFAAQIPKAQ